MLLEIQCKKFQVAGIEPTTGLPIWVAELSAPVTSTWLQAFETEVRTARGQGLPVADVTAQPGAQTLTFKSQADTAAAIARTIRDVVAQTNATVKRLEEENTKQLTEQAARGAANADKLRSLRDRFPNGV
jgi:hypothetical protein